MPNMSQLQGLSLRKASLFGMPHLGARYTDRSGGYEATTDVCQICHMRRATNVHHIVPRSVRHVFSLGGHELRSPLIALCGHGTDGCHGDCHGGARYEFEWVWNDPSHEDAWWSGDILGTYAPHDPALYRLGHWSIRDRRLSTSFSVGAL